MTTNTPSSVSDEERAEAVERDIRAAIWNAGVNGGMGQDLTLAFIRRAMDEPLMKRAIATMTDTRVAEAVDAETEACASCADDFDGPYGFPGVNEARKIAARIRNRPRQRAAIRNEGKSAPPVDQMKGEDHA